MSWISNRRQLSLAIILNFTFTFTFTLSFNILTSQKFRLSTAISTKQRKNKLFINNREPFLQTSCKKERDAQNRLFLSEQDEIDYSYQEYETIPIFGPLRRPVKIRPESHPNLGMWVFEQPHQIPLYTTMLRMGVFQLKTVEKPTTVIFNPMVPTPECLDKVVEIAGVPSDIIVPTNSYEHTNWLEGWTERFPDATFWKIPGVQVGAKIERDLTDESLPAEWDSEFAIAVLEGSQFFTEAYSVHKPTKTLFAVDSFNKLTQEHMDTSLSPLPLKLMGTFAEPSCSTKFLLWNKERCKACVSRVLQWEFEKIIPTHGECPIYSGNPVFQKAFSFLFES